MIVLGPSGIGKTEFVLDLVLKKDIIYDKHIEKVYYLYNNDQQRFAEVEKIAPYITFIKTIEEIPEDHGVSRLIVYDDKLVEFQRNKEYKIHIEDMFIRRSRHSQTSCIVILQTLFGTGIRTVANNATYTVVFDSPRNKMELGYLSREICPGTCSFLRDIMKDASSSRPYQYLLFDSTASMPNKYRIRNFVYLDRDSKIYFPKNDSDT
jgi:hypothetical protein